MKWYKFQPEEKVTEMTACKYKKPKKCFEVANINLPVL